MVEGRAALVTGPRGVGFDIARALRRGGARVCLTDPDPAWLDQAEAALGGGEDVLTVAAQGHDAAERAQVVERCVERFGSLDLLANNAATNPRHGPLADADLGQVAQVIEVGALAPLGWVQQALSGWLAAHGGAVVNVASFAWLEPEPDLGASDASTAALLHLTRQLAVELAPGVRVNAIAPALVTSRLGVALHADDEAAPGPSAMLRPSFLSDVGTAARFLLSDEAGWVSGETMVLDGGRRLAGSTA